MLLAEAHAVQCKSLCFLCHIIHALRNSWWFEACLSARWPANVLHDAGEDDLDAQSIHVQLIYSVTSRRFLLLSVCNM